MELAGYKSRRGLRDDLDHFFRKQIRDAGFPQAPGDGRAGMRIGNCDVYPGKLLF